MSDELKDGPANAPTGPGGLPSAQRVDPEVAALVRTCAQKIDDGLAPLVARELIHRDLAAIMAADLRVGVLTFAGVDASMAATLPRTIAAITALRNGDKVLVTVREDELEVGGS